MGAANWDGAKVFVGQDFDGVRKHSGQKLFDLGPPKCMEIKESYAIARKIKSMKNNETVFEMNLNKP